MQKIQLITAFDNCSHDNKMGIGYRGKLPWGKIPQDMTWFKNMTENKTVIMGGKTFDSLNNSPLPNRDNIVITSKAKLEDGSDDFYRSDYDNLFFCSSPDLVLRRIKLGLIQAPIIIGGASIYDFFLDYVDTFFITEIDRPHASDTFFPQRFKQMIEDGIIKLKFEANSVNIQYPSLYFKIYERVKK